MSYRIDEIEGIGPVYAAKLNEAGIETTENLLDKCCSPAGRKNVAETTGLGESNILKWANMADLMRISGVGPQYSELLNGAGVDTVKELRNRNADNLTAAMKAVNDEKKLARVAPPAATVAKWVEVAKTMEPKLSY